MSIDSIIKNDGKQTDFISFSKLLEELTGISSEQLAEHFKIHGDKDVKSDLE